MRVLIVEDDAGIATGLAATLRHDGHAVETRSTLEHAWDLLRMASFFERFDRLLTPCVPVPPFPVEQMFPETVAGKKMESYIDWVAPTLCVTLTGLPAMSVPAGLDRSNLPVGLQVVAPRWNEEGALSLAAAIERLVAMPESPLQA